LTRSELAFEVAEGQFTARAIERTGFIMGNIMGENKPALEFRFLRIASQKERDAYN